ncbi:MAG: response regulator transcription factor [Lachnospiraceae bacterium]|nr:response regulator transcription factor [Lachnospiraceae bacterium]
MIEVAICDDVREDAIELQSYFDSRMYEVNCDIFSNAMEFIAAEKTYDVIFLDFDLPGMSGEELAEKLREEETDSLLVFFTGTREPTPEIFTLQPFRYLMKDMLPGRMKREVGEILEKCRERKKAYHIYAKEAGDIVKVPVYTISYIELAKHGSIVHTVQKNQRQQYTLRENIREIGKKLEDSGFVQAHNSYLVNMEHIVRYHKTYIQLQEGIQLNVSRAYRKKFDLAFRRYLLNKG